MKQGWLHLKYHKRHQNCLKRRVFIPKSQAKVKRKDLHFVNIVEKRHFSPLLALFWAGETRFWTQTRAHPTLHSRTLQVARSFCTLQRRRRVATHCVEGTVYSMYTGCMGAQARERVVRTGWLGAARQLRNTCARLGGPVVRSNFLLPGCRAKFVPAFSKMRALSPS